IIIINTEECKYECGKAHICVVELGRNDPRPMRNMRIFLGDTRDPDQVKEAVSQGMGQDGLLRNHWNKVWLKQAAG
ncbi:MAG: hypothetical protein AMJ42_02725, partial [Deltaproteobacteria bacterium DG_8]